MISFENDYSEGCIPEILEALAKTNENQTQGYGVDEHSVHAKALIKETCEAPNADVYFVIGGTGANITVLDTILRSYQGVVCADSAHINTHETGALEATGHKCLVLPNHDGKISAQQVDDYLSEHANSPLATHVPQPGAVYISWPTETGTLYTKKELSDLHDVCAKWDVPLFCDGARIGYGLASSRSELTFPDFAKYCDIFYIGGTKVGALFGEAIVVSNEKYQKDFAYGIKPHLGLLAKGRMLGIQFEALFTDNNYLKAGHHGMAMAEKLTQAFIDKGYTMAYTTETNQIFPILTNEKIQELRKTFLFLDMEKVDDDHTIVRFCTSFMTKEENVDKLIAAL